MSKQLAFALILLLSMIPLVLTTVRLARCFSLTQGSYRISRHARRLWITLNVAIAQSRIFRRPVTGLFHALVFWGFCVILFGTVEMTIDGLSGRETSLSGLGFVRTLFIASADVFAVLVSIAIVFFLIRRLFRSISRFEGIEMKHRSHLDANIALGLILLLMISLSGMNIFHVLLQGDEGKSAMLALYPFSARLVIEAGLQGAGLHAWYECFWWSHILLILLFANILPYSKHFHVFMSVPNVYLSRLEPLGKLTHMDSITREVNLMLNPESVENQEVTAPLRFGVKDVEDISWKNYLDALACTECGRCTSVCPANITGKMLSPRKIIMDVRARMKERMPGLLTGRAKAAGDHFLLRNFITEEELWACTTCNACARECPVNINHPTLIVDMRRYLVLEEGAAPGGVKAMFNCIENNGAPWQFSSEDRMLWARGLEINRN